MPIIRHVLEYSVAEVRNGVIEGVKIVGLKSRNGYRYLEGALLHAIHLYEDAPVYVFHPSSKEKRSHTRKMEHHLGSLQNIRMADGGLFGDLHIRQSHCLAGTIVSSAKTQAGGGRNFGLSHNAQVEMNDDETEVTKIVSVNSVDLVDNPATTTNLLEELKEEEMDLAELEAVSKATGDAVATIAEGQIKIVQVLEGLAEKLEKAVVPPDKKANEKQRFGVLEARADDGTPAPIGNNHDAFLAQIRGFSTSDMKGAQV